MRCKERGGGAEGGRMNNKSDDPGGLDGGHTPRRSENTSQVFIHLTGVWSHSKY